MNLEVYHPKVSFLLEKYNLYLKKVYENIKESMIVPKVLKTEKFSIINDIIKFISNYIKKYGSNIDIINKIQGDNDDNKIISKISIYILDFIFDIDENDSDNSDDIENVNYEEFESDKENYQNNILLEEDEKENNDNEQLYFDVFYPKQKIKRKKK